MKIKDPLEEESKKSILDRAKTRMRGKPKEKLTDYLTPMRYQREYMEELKGKNEVDIQDLKRRARLKKDQSKSN